MGKQRDEKRVDEAIDRALTRFFYGKILDAMHDAEIELVQDEEYLAAAKVRDKIEELSNEFQVKINR